MELGGGVDKYEKNDKKQNEKGCEGSHRLHHHCGVHRYIDHPVCHDAMIACHAGGPDIRGGVDNRDG